MTPRFQDMRQRVWTLEIDPTVWDRAGGRGPVVGPSQVPSLLPHRVVTENPGT